MTPQDEVAALQNAGRLIEAAWVHYRACDVHPMASEEQLFELRQCFFAGAHLIFECIVESAQRRDDQNEAVRMTLLGRELHEYEKEYRLLHAIPAGVG